MISKSDIKSLAEADEQEVVAEVQVNFEYFKVDFLIQKPWGGERCKLEDS